MYVDLVLCIRRQSKTKQLAHALKAIDLTARSAKRKDAKRMLGGKMGDVNALQAIIRLAIIMNAGGLPVVQEVPCGISKCFNVSALMEIYTLLKISVSHARRTHNGMAIDVLAGLVSMKSKEAAFNVPKGLSTMEEIAFVTLDGLVIGLSDASSVIRPVHSALENR